MSHGDEEPAYIRALNPEQKAAVVHSGSPLLILAGAGSGKTRVITTKIAHLVDRQGVNPRSILAVTFTNKAAQEMKERVLAMVPHAEEVMVRTFHSFGAWFLRRNAKLAGLSPDFRIYDEDDSLSLLKSILGKSEDRGFLRRSYEEISRVKDLGIGGDAPPEEIERAGCAPDLYAAYEQRKQATGNVDFGDLILMPLQLLRHHPEVRGRSRQRFRVVLVDEYQDSNTAQFELLRELWEPGIYLCVVGDDDQSIYGFRGAEVGNILSFPKVFPGTEVVRLERNYRSTQAILDVASAVVANNTGRLGKTLWTENSAGELPAVSCLMDQDEEADFCAQIARDDFGGTDRDPLQDECAVPPVRGTVPQAGNPVPARRHGPLLRARGGEGRAGLAFPPCQPQRRGGFPTRRQPARPGNRRGQRGEDRRGVARRCRRGHGPSRRLPPFVGPPRTPRPVRARGFSVLPRGAVRQGRGGSPRRARPCAPLAHRSVRDVPHQGHARTIRTRPQIWKPS